MKFQIPVYTWSVIEVEANNLSEAIKKVEQGEADFSLIKDVALDTVDYEGLEEQE